MESKLVNERSLSSKQVQTHRDPCPLLCGQSECVEHACACVFALCACIFIYPFMVCLCPVPVKVEFFVLARFEFLRVGRSLHATNSANKKLVFNCAFLGFCATKGRNKKKKKCSQ